MFDKDFLINWAVATVACVIFVPLIKIPSSVEGFCIQVAIGVAAILYIGDTQPLSHI